MRIRGITFAVVAIAAAVAFAQSPTFDVVSIKRHVAEPGPMAFSSNVIQRPDGGITMTNVPVATLITRAYVPHVPADMVGLPSWAMSERYDISATSTLSTATVEDRAAMIRAMLADRFKFVAHIEKREREVYDLLLARSDGKLGSGLTPLDKDCAPEIAAAQRAAESASTPPAPPVYPDVNVPPPPCTLRSVGMRPPASGDQMQGETTMEVLSRMLRMSSGRFVVDKTGLTGTYRVDMFFDFLGARRPPSVTPPPDAPPTVFTAVREQLGLKLESSRAPMDTLVIDRLERPTEN
jgi:uncharacterized protein (TIGR03435 family)